MPPVRRMRSRKLASESSVSVHVWPQSVPAPRTVVASVVPVKLSSVGPEAEGVQVVQVVPVFQESPTS